MTVWFTASDLRRLSDEWIADELLRDASECAFKNEKRVEALRTNLAEDVVVVHSALLTCEPKPGDPPALPAKLVETVVRSAMGETSRARRSRRARHLYWLLARLGGEHRLTFTLPADKQNRQPRALAFDAGDPHLPKLSRFAAWQKHLASRSLRAGNTETSAAPRTTEERGFYALACLFAFGGPCGHTALSDAARLSWTDLSHCGSSLWLREQAGRRTLELSLHPVQTLCFHLYRRAYPVVTTSDSPDGDTAGGDRSDLFPFLTTNKGRAAFRSWLTKTLGGAEQANGAPHAGEEPRAGIKSLLAGARRWLLEIYPVYMMSVLANRFAATASGEEDDLDAARSAVDEIAAWRSSAAQRPPQDAEYLMTEKLVRRNLRQQAARYLGVGTGEFSRRHINDLSEHFVVDPPETHTDDWRAGREWNLVLLVESLKRRLASHGTDRYRTFTRWWNTGCSLIDALDGTPAWTLADEDLPQLAARLKPTTRRDLKPHVRAIRSVAAEYGLTATTGGDTVLLRLDQPPARPRQPPTAEQIEKIADRLHAQAERAGASRVHLRRAACLYFDLLALGLRKGETISVTAYDIDHEKIDGVDVTDLYVRGTKTPAARRRTPIDSHPHSGCAERVSERARSLRSLQSETRDITPMMDAVGRTRFLRDTHPDLKGSTKSITRLDRLVAEAARYVGLESFSPHDARHASITSSLIAHGDQPEIIAKHHGQVDLPVTFENYVHGLSEIQARDLACYLARPENKFWITATDVGTMLGISKQAINKRYGGGAISARRAHAVDQSGIVIKRAGKANYVEAAAVCRHLAERHQSSSGSTR